MAIEIKSSSVAKKEKKPNSFLQALNAPAKLTAKDRMFFTEQLTFLLETDLNLHDSLQVLKLQANQPSINKLLDSLIADIAEGKKFSDALSRYPETFDSSYVNLVAASEQGGFMHEVLSQLLEMDKKREELRNTMVSAFSYPAFLVVFSIAIVIFILVVVFPKFDDMFANIKDDLPITTIYLMAASDILINYWIPILVALALMLLLILYSLKRPNIRGYIDRLKLRIPIIKDIFIKLYLTQTLKIMSISLQSGVSIVDTISACKNIVPNTAFQDFLDDVDNLVHEGSGIAAGFTKVDFIPPLVKQLISTGEESGNLPKVMARISDYYERELAQRLKVLSKIAEPIMLVVMGLIVGILVSSLILPIFKLSKGV